MKIAFVIYNDMTALDFIGIYDPLTRLRTMGYMPDLTWELCSFTDEVFDNTGLAFSPDSVGKPLAGYDMVVVPGGFGSRKLAKDEAFLAWLKTASACRLKVSVCTGSLLLGAAGFLAGKKATTHPKAMEELSIYCDNLSPDRVVDAGDVITAGGVTAAIDIGLYLCGKLAGPEAKEAIRRQMDYRC